MDAKEMHSHHRGEAIYTAEVDVHFPQLSIGDTLTFASRARQPRQLPHGLSRSAYADHIRDVTMAMFGISHTANTKVGNDFIRGVSGGERKRVTIAEASLSGAPLQCWDNSTRGLDSANATEFCRTLRLQADLFRTTACVSIYQSPQTAYDLFDKVTVIYEGRQIFFGRADEAKHYFIDLGFECPARQTTPDFLTSMTSPLERVIRPGYEGRTPRTPDEFAAAWKDSAHYKALRAEIDEYKTSHPINGPQAEAFRSHKQSQQAKGQRKKSPFTISYLQQIQLCLWRSWKNLTGDPGISVGAIIGNIIIALILGSAFFNLEETSSSFFQRGALIFFALLMNGFASIIEVKLPHQLLWISARCMYGIDTDIYCLYQIIALYAQRPIVEKHSRYALYHPSADAIASMICDLPFKVLNTIAFNTVLYFMTNLRREPGPFFFFLLISFVTIVTGSMIFRTIASSSRTVFQAQVPAAVLFIGLVCFTGFVIPKQYMLGWCKWITYIDPLAYAFESLMVNEFYGRRFPCSEYVPIGPEYEDVARESRVCSSVGATPGEDFIDGGTYTASTFGYQWGNRWGNLGIIIAFALFFMMTHIISSEFISERRSKGEVLVYRRGQKPATATAAEKNVDPESGADTNRVVPVDHSRGQNKEAGVLEQQTSVFQWHDVCYDIKLKGGEVKRILDHVDGWVRPGTLTALMGVSGAGKTTLLDCLADRASIGILTGEMLVDGRPRDISFQRKTGYVQQQDLHLQTSTVREALNFSALLRQPPEVTRSDKLAYVDEVIKLLDMQDYADAVVGVPGEGLNVEQRKRLTIGVELAAKPPLLLFVDEPTSGLDSQTSWAILDLLEKLTKAGQAVLCTIHQPSAMLFQRFDRLLFLAEGGKTVYFGEIGDNSETLIKYFQRNGGHECPKAANPAEWMLEVIGATPGSGNTSDTDWFQTWRNSPEYREVQAELERIKTERKALPSHIDDDAGSGSHRELAAPFIVQLRENLYRVFQQYWRSPAYIYSKFALCTLVAIFIGFTFYDAPISIQGLKNQMFAIFMILIIFNELVSQAMPQFVIQRSLYEARERPSKVYSWKVFVLSQIIVELTWNSLMAAIMFFCWYYPIGLYRNAIPTDSVAERGGLMFLFLLAYLLFTGTLTHFCIAGLDSAEGGAQLAQLMFILSLIFCGVLVSPSQLPRFWIFMYRVSPFTYLVSGMLSTGLANTEVICADNELLVMQPPSNQTCGEYLQAWIHGQTNMPASGGYLVDDNATSDCQFCPLSETNAFLSTLSSNYDDRWRNFGILCVYIVFNMGATLLVYWLARVPKKSSKEKKKKQE